MITSQALPFLSGLRLENKAALVYGDVNDWSVDTNWDGIRPQDPYLEMIQTSLSGVAFEELVDR